MFGGIRLFLAFIVALVHLHYGVPRIVLSLVGIPAGVSFYVISGYAMTGLVRSHYADVRLVPRFYFDRMLRIGPQYYALLLVVVLWWYMSGMPAEFFLSAKMTAARFLANLTIFP